MEDKFAVHHRSSEGGLNHHVVFTSEVDGLREQLQGPDGDDALVFEDVQPAVKPRGGEVQQSSQIPDAGVRTSHENGLEEFLVSH